MEHALSFLVELRPCLSASAVELDFNTALPLRVILVSDAIDYTREFQTVALDQGPSIYLSSNYHWKRDIYSFVYCQWLSSSSLFGVIVMDTT